MSNKELELLEKWQSDPSFINWARLTNEVDVTMWNDYFKANPQHLDLADTVRFSIMNIAPKTLEKDSDKAQQALVNLQNKLKSTSEQKSSSKNRTFPLLWKIAASVLIFITVSIGGYSIFNGMDNEIVYETSNEQKQIDLVDGSTVTLNANSSIRYFKKEVRNIRLTGEAYFQVAKNSASDSRFQVHTQDLVVTVLGTQFNVNSSLKGETRVYLDEGVVKLSLGDNVQEEIEMQPGELVSYSKAQNKILENRKVNSLEETAWKEIVISFEDSSIADVLATISLVYDVTFESNLPDQKDQLFTGGIPVNDLDITLKTVKEVFQINIKMVDGKYLID